jgi:dihydrodiol dehydrogenase / D-xylose 1-dehydrogenase (NADP)
MAALFKCRGVVTHSNISVLRSCFLSLSSHNARTTHSIHAYSTMSKFELKWGILATGGIAESFARDLWPNPETRGVKDIEHKVVAAASSSSAKRAEDFLKEVRAPEGAKAYGSYKELVEDPNVDIIYVATPHSHHYQNARLCLEAGKNVLCEKAFTTNAAQLETLIKIAKEKNVFLMEAVSHGYVMKARWLLI